jgi:hypothetical protein
LASSPPKLPGWSSGVTELTRLRRSAQIKVGIPASVVLMASELIAQCDAKGWFIPCGIAVSRDGLSLPEGAGRLLRSLVRMDSLVQDRCDLQAWWSEQFGHIPRI